MLKNTQTMLKFGLVAGTLLSSSSVWAASSEYAEYVESITFKREQGIGYDVVLKNTSANKDVDAVNIEPTKSKMDIAFEGSVKCDKNRKTSFREAKIYFGDVFLFVDTIQSNGAADLGAYYPTSHEWTGLKWVTESGNNEDFSISFNKVKNLAPNFRFDPVAELDKKLQAHLNSGKTKASFYQKDQVIEVTRPVTLAGACKKYLNPGHTPRKWGYKTASIKFKIIYHGDPDVKLVPKLNPVLGNNQGNNQYDAQDLPLELSEATFQPNMPHYIGKCIPDQNPKIRFNFKGNGKGQVKFMIKDGGTTILTTSEINYDSKQQHKRHFDFYYPLISKMNQYPSWRQINKTMNHTLRIKAKVKDIDNGTWTGWEDYGEAIWRHRCTPQVTVPTTGGGKAFQGQGQGANQGNKLMIKPVNPQPKPKRATTN